MKTYIGVKMLQAEPMTYYEFCEEQKRLYGATDNQHGYKVVYPDGYVSWSPKNVFEKAYMEVGDNNTIEHENVESFVASWEEQKWGEKTTIVKATLVNGFEITEFSSCVDPANYNHDIGVSICKERIYSQIWQLLGFLLQTAVKGLK